MWMYLLIYACIRVSCVCASVLRCDFFLLQGLHWRCPPCWVAVCARRAQLNIHHCTYHARTHTNTHTQFFFLFASSSSSSLYFSTYIKLVFFLSDCPRKSRWRKKRRKSWKKSIEWRSKTSRLNVIVNYTTTNNNNEIHGYERRTMIQQGDRKKRSFDDMPVCMCVFFSSLSVGHIPFSVIIIIIVVIIDICSWCLVPTLRCCRYRCRIYCILAMSMWVNRMFRSLSTDLSTFVPKCREQQERKEKRNLNQRETKETGSPAALRAQNVYMNMSIDRLGGKYFHNRKSSFGILIWSKYELAVVFVLDTQQRGITHKQLSHIFARFVCTLTKYVQHVSCEHDAYIEAYRSI